MVVLCVVQDGKAIKTLISKQALDEATDFDDEVGYLFN